MIAALLAMAFAPPVQVGDFWALQRVSAWRNEAEDLDYRRKESFDIVVKEVGKGSAKIAVTRKLIETSIDGEVVPVTTAVKADEWEQELRYAVPCVVVAPNRADIVDVRLSQSTLLWLPEPATFESADISRFKLAPMKITVSNASLVLTSENFRAEGGWRRSPIPETFISIPKFPLPGSSLSGELRMRTTFVKGQLLGKEITLL
jgi:hypothetical protein